MEEVPENSGVLLVSLDLRSNLLWAENIHHYPKTQAQAIANLRPTFRLFFWPCLQVDRRSVLMCEAFAEAIY